MTDRSIIGGERPDIPALIRAAGVRFARMTTRQLFAALASEPYRRLRALCGDERKLNTGLDRWGADRGMTFSELMDRFSTRPETLSRFQEDLVDDRN